MGCQKQRKTTIEAQARAWSRDEQVHHAVVCKPPAIILAVFSNTLSCSLFRSLCAMAPAHYAPRPHRKYGSVADTEQPTAYSSLLHTSPGCGITRKGYPARVGKQQHQPQQNKHYLRDPETGESISWKLVVVTVMCGLAFLAGSGVSLSQTSGSRSAVATAGRFFEIGGNTGIPAAEIQPSEPSSVVVGHDAHGVTGLEFTALNFYHVRDGKPGQDYPWLKDVKLIEPHRDTTLAVVGPREGFDYRWEVRAGSSSGSGGVGDVQATATGPVTIVVLTQLDENVVVLEEVDGDGRVTNPLEETVLVKYVRREIRTVTDDEKEELLDAVRLY